MSQEQLSEAVIKLSLDGFKVVNAQLMQMEKKTKDVAKEASKGFSMSGLAGLAKKAGDQMKGLQDRIAKVGSAARTYFAVGMASVLGFVRAASPGDFMKFESAMARVAVQIGSLFLPVIRTLTDWLNKLADTLNNLTPVQREQIGNWTKFGLIVLGVVGFGSKFVGLVPAIISGLITIGTTAIAIGVKIAGATTVATGGLNLIIPAIVAVYGALIALGVAVGVVGVAASGKFDQIKRSAVSLFEGVKRLAVAIYEAVKPIFVFIGEVIVKVFTKAVETFNNFLPRVIKVFQAIGEYVSKIVPVFYEVFGELENLFLDVMEALEPLIDRIYNGLADAIQTVVPYVKLMVTALLDGIKSVVHQIRVLAQVAKAIKDNPWSAFSLGDVIKGAELDIKRTDMNRERERKQQEQGQKAGASQTTQKGPIQVYKPELFGIAEAMRKAQTASLGDSPELAAAKERNRIAKQSDGKLSQIEENTRDNKNGLR